MEDKMSIKTISEGSNFEYEFSFDQKDVIKFAEASGDRNPLHLDENFAKTTVFKKRIIHGFLGASVFSKVFGTLFPGNGTIYLKQDLSFFKPMFTERKYKAKFEVVQTYSEKSRATVKTIIEDETEAIVISGEALIQHPNIG